MSSPFTSLGGPLVAVLISLWIVRPACGAGPVAGVDVIGHLLRVTFGVEYLLANGRLDGWNPTTFLGYQQYLFRGPGLPWLVGLVKAAALGRLSTVAALNIAALGCFVMAPVAVVFLARSFGLGPSASGIAALLALLPCNHYGPGLRGLFGIGLLDNQVGAIFFCLALGGLARVVLDGRACWVTFTACALAGLILSHLVSAMVLFLLAALCLPWLLPRAAHPWSAVVRVFLSGAMTIGIVAFWLIPFIIHRNLRGFLPGWGTPPLLERLAAILRGDSLFAPRIAWVMLLGWAFAVVEVARGRWQALAFAIASVAYLILAHTLIHLTPNDVTTQLSNRGLGYAGLVATLPMALLLASLARSLRVIGDALVLIASSALAVFGLPRETSFARSFAQPGAALQEAAAVLARVVPPGARFLAPQEFSASLMETDIKSVGPDRWLSWRSGRNSLTGLVTESSATSWVNNELYDFFKRPPEMSADAIGRLGVTHVMAPQGLLTDRLVASRRFEVVWSQPRLAILEVQPRRHSPPPASLVTIPGEGRARMRSAEPGHLRLKIRTPAPTPANIAVTWSPKWHGTLNGTACRLDRSPDGLITLDLPAGSSRIGLDYLPDDWDRLGRLITVTTLAGIVTWWLRRFRQVRGRASGPEPAGAPAPQSGGRGESESSG